MITAIQAITTFSTAAPPDAPALAPKDKRIAADLSYQAEAKRTDESPERAVMRLFMEFSTLQEGILENMRKDLAAHVATLQEMKSAEEQALRLTGLGRDLTDDDFNTIIKIDVRSPIGQGLNDTQKGPKQMTLAELLRTYNVIKSDEKLPVTQEQVKALKDILESRNTTMTSTTQLQQLNITKVTTSREQAFSMISNLARQLIETFSNVIKRM